MKNILKRMIGIAAIIWGCIVIFVTADTIWHYLNGDYIKIDAEVGDITSIWIDSLLSVLLL